MKSKIVFLSEKAKLPQKGKNMCYDISTIEDGVLKPGERRLFRTGLKIALKKGYHASIRPRSGLAVKSGIDVLAGQIDNGFRGEWMVCLINHGKEDFQVKSGDRIAQFKIEKNIKTKWEVVDSLDETERNENGFGSTGVT